jgi:MFS family permease
MGTSTYVAGVLLVMRQFDISRTVALLPIVVYTLGFSLGPLVAAPISEIYGRLIVYRTGLPMLMIFNAIAAASNNLTVLVVFRFLAGFGGSGVLAVGAGTIADLWSSRQAGLVGLTYILAPFLGPTLGPLIGAYIIAQYDNDWKWSIWVILVLCAPISISLLFMRETSRSRIIYLKSSRTREVTQGGFTTRQIGIAMLRPLHMILFEVRQFDSDEPIVDLTSATKPLAFFLSLYTGFNFAMIFSFFGSYPFVYSRVYEFDLKEVGLTYIGLVVGYLLALVTFGYFDRTKYQPELQRTNGAVAPEHRLYAAMFGSFLLPIGLFVSEHGGHSCPSS